MDSEAESVAPASASCASRASADGRGDGEGRRGHVTGREGGVKRGGAAGEGTWVDFDTRSR
jgi:hypothetical protein